MQYYSLVLGAMAGLAGNSPGAPHAIVESGLFPDMLREPVGDEPRDWLHLWAYCLVDGAISIEHAPIETFLEFGFHPCCEVALDSLALVARLVTSPQKDNSGMEAVLTRYLSGPRIVDIMRTVVERGRPSLTRAATTLFAVHLIEQDDVRLAQLALEPFMSDFVDLALVQTENQVRYSPSELSGISLTNWKQLEIKS
jgi:hypothetical protein